MDPREFAEVVEVCPASDLTEALSLLAEARGERDKLDDEAERLGIERAEAWAERDRAEAQLAQARAALDAPGVDETRRIIRARTALSNTTREE